ncbi:hypothetical protein CEXT_597531 [Caerostris extrusa]|uniref:Uncharacterized protein n=1 Tax=Caerostris extrusa TaxID=172846 RepID=A0AAV4WGC7_CAEEX|nr:hypothetical protein CEXT_597531 [Caerostris extrusa]
MGCLITPDLHLRYIFMCGANFSEANLIILSTPTWRGNEAGVLKGLPRPLKPRVSDRVFEFNRRSRGVNHPQLLTYLSRR